MIRNRELSPAVLKRLTALAADDPSPVVRLYVSSALQRVPLAKRWEPLEGLLAHSEDVGDHNLPLMYWYAAEPLADEDPTRALRWHPAARFRWCWRSWPGGWRKWARPRRWPPS